MSAFRIDVTSDVRCPFCLLGITQLKNAIGEYNTAHPATPLKPEIRVLPYQLDPTIGPEPADKNEVMRKKFGDRAQGLSEMMRKKIIDAGYAEPNKNATTSSSHTAQRLQAYTLSKFPEKQLDLYQDILESYHIKGVYPAHIPTLASIAVKHEIFPSIESATEWLEGDEFEKEVQRGYNEARGMGVTGVPFFVFQGKYAASGAMGEGEFVHLFEEIQKREGAAKA